MPTGDSARHARARRLHLRHCGRLLAVPGLRVWRHAGARRRRRQPTDPRCNPATSPFRYRAISPRCATRALTRASSSRSSRRATPAAPAHCATQPSHVRRRRRRRRRRPTLPPIEPLRRAGCAQAQPAAPQAEAGPHASVLLLGRLARRAAAAAPASWCVAAASVQGSAVRQGLEGRR